MKYVRLYTIMSRIPNNKEIINMPSHHTIDIDIYTYLKQSSLLSEYELYQNLGNPFCVYSVWPLIYKP